MIAQDGVDASLEEIARRADVGIATLYRNFPTRDDLVRALYDIALTQLETVREEIFAAPSAWDGVVVYAERVAEWLVADPSLPPILKRLATIDPSARSAEFDKFIASLVAEAKRDGDLRADVETVDLALLMTLVGSLGGLGDGYAGQWRIDCRRQPGIVLDGLAREFRANVRPPGSRRASLASAKDWRLGVRGCGTDARAVAVRGRCATRQRRTARAPGRLSGPSRRNRTCRSRHAGDALPARPCSRRVRARDAGPGLRRAHRMWFAHGSSKRRVWPSSRMPTPWWRHPLPQRAELVGVRHA